MYQIRSTKPAGSGQGPWPSLPQGVVLGTYSFLPGYGRPSPWASAWSVPPCYTGPEAPRAGSTPLRA